MFNTLPYNSFPASTAKFEEGKNDAIQAEIDAMKDGTNIDSFGDVETALSLKANSADMETALATKTNISNIASTFDAESGVYEIGDKVIYEGVLYEFTSAHSTAGDWDSSEVQPVKVSELINSLESGLTGLIAEVVTSEPVAASGSTTVPYPSGFTFSNTGAVSVYITDGNAKYVGDEFAKATLTAGNIALQNKMTTAAYVVGVVLAKVS